MNMQIILILTVLASLIYLKFLTKRFNIRLKRIILFSLIFLTLYPFLSMWGHLFGVGYVTFLQIKEGVFQYDLKFYALIQFGVLIIIINGYLFRSIKKISLGDRSSFSGIMIACLLQMVIMLPLVPLNPISAILILTSLAFLILVWLEIVQISANGKSP